MRFVPVLAFPLNLYIFGRKSRDELIPKLEFPFSEFPSLNHNGVIELVQRNLLSKAERPQLFHNKSHKLMSLHVGDKVLVRTHPQASADFNEIK